MPVRVLKRFVLKVVKDILNIGECPCTCLRPGVSGWSLSFRGGFERAEAAVGEGELAPPRSCSTSCRGGASSPSTRPRPPPPLLLCAPLPKNLPLRAGSYPQHVSSFASLERDVSSQDTDRHKAPSHPLIRPLSLQRQARRGTGPAPSGSHPLIRPLSLQRPGGSFPKSWLSNFIV